MEAVRHCVYTLRRLLSPNYAVISVEGNAIIKEPWTTSCALLVFPGGADLGYCRTLNGEGNRRIAQYVERGGSYLGFCAGAYYGSRRCEFEEGNKKLEVMGDRELAFYPGVCRGLAFPGFVYHSEAGARPVELKVSKTNFPQESVPDTFRSYYNGGGVFVDAPDYENLGVQVLADYTENLKVDAEERKAAVVYCKVADGAAILSCPHPEYVIQSSITLSYTNSARFAPVNLDRESAVPDYSKLIEALSKDDKPRTDFLRACLLKLGLEISMESTTVPSLSRLHLSSLSPAMTAELVGALSEIITVQDGEEYIQDENDTFHIEKPSTWALSSLMNALPGVGHDETDQSLDEDRFLDYDSVVKRLVVHENDPPPSKETPFFNHQAYYANLKYYEPDTERKESSFGNHLLYGEVVTSTNTMLEKCAYIWTPRLPSLLKSTGIRSYSGVFLPALQRLQRSKWQDEVAAQTCGSRPQAL